MKITINGEEHSFQESLTVLSVLNSIGFDTTKVAVELNLEIVPKSLYTDTVIKDGDRIEIVHFIGGGMDSNIHENDIETCKQMARDINVDFYIVKSSRWNGKDDPLMPSKKWRL